MRQVEQATRCGAGRNYFLFAALMAEDSKRLWFENGCWWFRKHDGTILEISSLIKRERFKVGAIAKALGLELRTFERLVKDAVGISPGKWLRMERAVHARQRLREGCSVKQLASEFGFQHQGDFCVEFKRWHSVSPTDFQRNAGKWHQ